MNIEKKANWTSIYTQPTPAPYMQNVLENEYSVPTYALQYLHPLLDMMQAERDKRIRIIDLGASYGILSALLLHDLSFPELIGFYTENGQIRERTWQEMTEFYKNQPVQRQDLEFFLIDSSKPAMDFSERVNLCAGAFSMNLREDELSAELKTIIQDTDLFMSFGSIGYLGDRFFRQAFKIISENQSAPLFAFTAARTFYPVELEALFAANDYAIIKSNVPLVKGRRFVNATEQQTAIQSLHRRNIDTIGLEDDGYFACEFFLGVPIGQKQALTTWLSTTDSLIQSGMEPHE